MSSSLKKNNYFPLAYVDKQAVAVDSEKGFLCLLFL
jgi:hypothetical protein